MKTWRGLSIMMGVAVSLVAWNTSALAVDASTLARPLLTKQDDATTAAFRLIGKSSVWELVAVVKMQFQTFHTQGLVKIDDTFFVSAVENIYPRIQFRTTDALWDFSTDRTPGIGRGWLFKFDMSGNLLGHVQLDVGHIYHPGGIDFDGSYIWVPVAENRPNSQTIIYRVDPDNLDVEAVFRVPDHIGSLIHNTDRHTLHGMSWGSRRMYTWEVKLKDNGDTARVRSKGWVPNPEAYIDYQDCKYVGIDFMLCGGLNTYDTPLGAVTLGGIDLVDLKLANRPRPVHQIPIQEYVDDNNWVTLLTFNPQNPELVVTNNAFWAEPLENGPKVMRFYFMTEADNQADLLIYDVTVPFLPPASALRIPGRNR